MNITVANFFHYESTECFFVENNLKTATSVDFESYNCFDCKENAVGSFLYIKKEEEGGSLQLGDIKV